MSSQASLPIDAAIPVSTTMQPSLLSISQQLM
jgi:hypothetical protein